MNLRLLQTIKTVLPLNHDLHISFKMSINLSIVTIKYVGQELRQQQNCTTGNHRNRTKQKNKETQSKLKPGNSLKKEYMLKLKLNSIPLLEIELKLTDSLSLNLTYDLQKTCSINIVTSGN